jgi:protein-disulfide isomerase
MKKFVNTTIYMMMLIIFLIAAIGGSKAVNAQSPDSVVAIVNGKSITQKEVDDSITSQLLPLEQQLYALRKAALENLITRAVLEEAARKKSISLDELKKELTGGKVEISPAQVEELYTENASVFAAMSPDEAKERLRLDLETQERMKFYRAALAELRKTSSIELHLREPISPSVTSDVGSSPTMGPKDAAVTIVEFSDFQCPYCKGAQSTLKQILQKYGSQVRLIFKHLPLDIHAEAFASAKAAFCADEQGAFWKYQDALFASDSLSPAVLKKAASNLGLDLSKFGSCVNSVAAHTSILKDLAEAKRLGISSTRTFIINGRLFRGTPGLEDFQAVIQRELKSAQDISRAKQP